MIFRFAILLTLLTLAHSNQSCQAQDDHPLSDNAEIAALQTQFREFREEFRGYVKAVQQAGFRYMNSPTPDESFVYWDEYEEKVKAGNAVLDRWKPIGLELFDRLTEHSEKIDDELVYFVCKIAENLFENSEYERTYDLANKLIKKNPENKFAQVYKVRAGILTNRFDDEIATLITSNKEHFQKEDVISGNETNLISNLYYLDELLKAELEIRKRETEANDLPLIMLETTKGNIEIELFENDAPDTVGNFVNLVEQKFYDQLVFHAVLDKTAAETGAVDNDLKIRSVDYQIYDEDRKRNIFAGSVVMVSETRHSGASRFFIALAALPSISGTQTVIGRVKTGMDAVYALNKTHKMGEDEPIPLDGVTPDKIITAKVIRKRDHEYVPNKVNSDNDK